MKNGIPFLLVSVFLLSSCNNNSSKQVSEGKSPSLCNDAKCSDQSTTINNNYTCKLTTPELQQRKATVLKSLQKQILDKKELPNGYSFKFTGTDEMIDELTAFAKTERRCCGFFIFNLSIAGDTTEVWFTITGEKNAKELIKSELEL
jgi:hypothetical protein